MKYTPVALFIMIVSFTAFSQHNAGMTTMFQHQYLNAREVKKISGNITVHYKKKYQKRHGLRGDFPGHSVVVKKKPIQVGLGMMGVGGVGLGFSAIVGYTFKADVKKRGRDVKPWKTDSIVVTYDGRELVGYPDKRGRFWLFPVDTGTISIYAAHPSEKEWETRLKLASDTEMRKLSNSVYLQNSESTTNSNVTVSVPGNEYDTTLGELLKSSPVLLFEYKERPMKTVERFNQLSEEQFIHAEKKQELTQAAATLFFSLADSIVDTSSVERMNQLDSSFVLSMVGEVIVAVNENDLSRADTILKLLTTKSKENDILYRPYLVHYASAYYNSALGNYAKAGEHYQYVENHSVKSLELFAKYRKKEMRRLARKQERKERRNRS